MPRSTWHRLGLWGRRRFSRPSSACSGPEDWYPLEGKDGFSETRGLEGYQDGRQCLAQPGDYQASNVLRTSPRALKDKGPVSTAQQIATRHAESDRR